MDLAFAVKFEKPVTLAEIKQLGEFGDWALVRQGRLSTMEVPEKFVEWFHEHHPKAKV